VLFLGFKIEKASILGSPHIGIFMYANNFFAIVPEGITRTTKKTIEEVLEVEVIEATIGGSRLLGIFLTGNDNILLVSPIVYPEELDELKSQLSGKTRIEVFETKNTAIGNLLTINNKGALASTDFTDEEIEKLRSLLGVKVRRTELLNYKAIGSLIACNDKVALAHPLLKEEETKVVSETLDVAVSGATINEGIGLVKSGVLINNKGLLVGSNTTGPELMNIQALFL
jgi:translation initiation factor 6